MNDRNDYKVRGKGWQLDTIQRELRANKIPVWRSWFGGFLRVEVNNGAELELLQKVCNEVGAKYDLF